MIWTPSPETTARRAEILKQVEASPLEKFSEGLMRKGKRRLTHEAITAIKAGLDEGTPGAILAKLHDVSPSTVSLIKHRKRWRGVS